MRLEVDHRALDMSPFQAIKVLVRVKFAEECLIPVIDVHIDQVAAETFRVPVHW
jgi:hypothetical protein